MRWLGHECPSPRICFASIDTLQASVWFIRRGPQCRMPALRVRVQVDGPAIGDGVTSILREMHLVNGCTRGDGIDVRYQPGQVPDRLAGPVAHRVRVSPLMGARLVEMPGPSDDDLRTFTPASQW